MIITDPQACPKNHACPAVGMGVRYWTIRTLGPRWTTRVVVVPGEALVASGPYRLLRHPNYLGVVLELIALPLVHTAWVTAALASVANGLVLRRRIEVEAAALSRSRLDVRTVME